MFSFFVPRGTVTQKRYGREDAANTEKERMFAYSAAQYAARTLPFAGNPVFAAVAAAVCLVEIVVVERFVVRLATNVLGTDRSHSAVSHTKTIQHDVTSV
jgi:hypothetical protein